MTRMQENIADLYGDNPADPSVELHQRLHDDLARVRNAVWDGPGAAGGRPMILDTDFTTTDMDDAVALRYLLNKDQLGDIDLLGIVVSSNNYQSPAAIDNFCTRQGRPDLPIGAWQSGVAYTPPSPSWVANLAALKRRELPRTDSSLIANSTRVYRRLLAKRTAKDVRVLVVGFQNAFAAFLQSPADDLSPLTGLQLAAAAIETVYVMGGEYPSGNEFNFSGGTTATQTKASASYVMSNCPVPIVLLGFEVGNGVVAGGSSRLLASDDLVATALKDFVASGASGNNVPGQEEGRRAWDPLTAALACADTPEAAGYSTVVGTNVVSASSGDNTFTSGAGGPHRYVVPATEDEVRVGEIERHMRPLTDRFRPRESRYHPELDTTWTPADARVPPVGWWKADGLPLGALAGSWTSVAGNHSFTQAVAANQPTVVDDGGKRALQFSGTNWIDCPDAILRTPDLTVFVVARSQSNTANVYQTLIAVPVSLSAHTSPYVYWGMGKVRDALWGRPSLLDNARGPQQAPAFWSLDKIWELHSDIGNAKINGVGLCPALGHQTATYPNATAVRMGANGAGGEGFIGVVREVLIFPSAMRTPDIRAVRAYLRRTYGGLL